MRLPNKRVVRVQFPVHGLPEAGVHWIETYQNHQIAVLNMKPTARDACFLITSTSLGPFDSIDGTKEAKPFVIVCMQVYDTLNSGNSAFAKLEEESRKFKCKPAVFLSDKQYMRFNSATVSTKGGVVTFAQQVLISLL